MKPKVLIINTINSIPSNEQFQDLATYMTANGFEVLHLSDNQKPNYNNVKVKSYKKNISFFSKLRFFTKQIFYFKPDLVVSTFSSSKYIDIISYFLKFRWIATYQSAFYKKSFVNILRFRKINKLLILSSPMRNELLRMYPHLKNRIYKINNSFNFKNYDFKKKQNILLHVGNGNLNSNGKLIKGTDILIKAFKLSKENITGPVDLYIIGNYPANFIKEYSDENVFFLGKKSHDEVLDYMSMSKVFALPSRNEAFGQVFIEAMQYGCSLIGADKTGAVDIVQKGKYGYVHPQEDIKSLSYGIKTIFKNYVSPHDCWNYYENKRFCFSRTEWVQNMNGLVLKELNI